MHAPQADTRVVALLEGIWPFSRKRRFAQHGEDTLLWQIFGGRRRGYYIEVGAYDGVTFSNTYLLEQRGWQGILVEPSPEMAARCRAARPRSRVIEAACGGAGARRIAPFTVAAGVDTLSYLSADTDHVERCRREGARLRQVDVLVLPLDEIIHEVARACSPGRGPRAPNGDWAIDVVSIDVEGSELEVLQGFDLARHHPRVVVVENDRPSGAAVAPYMRDHGYLLFHRQVINEFYAPADAVPPM